MPNLTYVDRLFRFYEDDKNIFSLIMVKYALEGNRVQASDVLFEPIEFLDWGCLTVNAGTTELGQIEISDSNHIVFNYGYSRKEWMLTLCKSMYMLWDKLHFEFPKERFGIEEILRRLLNLQIFWMRKPDTWV